MEPAWGTAKRNNLVLDALAPAERKELLSMSRPCHYPARRQIFLKGHPGDSLLLIETGRVEISLTSPSGERSIIAYLGADDCVGEMAVLMGSERTADTTATTDVTGKLILRVHMLRFLMNHPEATLGLVADLCRKLEKTTGALADHVVATGSTRLAKVLADLFSRWGIEDSEGGYRLHPAVSQSDLGEMSGLTRESVNRQIKIWETDGILRRDGRELVVRDPQRLVEIATV